MSRSSRNASTSPGRRWRCAVVELGHVGVATGGCREAERGSREAESLDLACAGHAGVEQQVTTRDAHIDRTGTDVGRDVLGAEEEELDVVLGVDDMQGLGVPASGVARLGEHVGGGLGERALVGNGDAQHGVLSVREERNGAHHRCR